MVEPDTATVPEDVGWQVRDSVPNGKGMPKFPDFPAPADPVG